MREGTSGVWVAKSSQGIRIGYEDYGVSEFGGGDFERTYSLNKENAKKLIAALRKEYKGSLKEMIVAAFGERFADSSFWFFCKKHGIEYSSSTWSG